MTRSASPRRSRGRRVRGRSRRGAGRRPAADADGGPSKRRTSASSRPRGTDARADAAGLPGGERALQIGEERPPTDVDHGGDAVDGALGGAARSAMVANRPGGRLSTTNQPRSSRHFAAVLRPAPDRPVMIVISRRSGAQAARRAAGPLPRASVRRARSPHRLPSSSNHLAHSCFRDAAARRQPPGRREIPVGSHRRLGIARCDLRGAMAASDRYRAPRRSPRPWPPAAASASRRCATRSCGGPPRARVRRRARTRSSTSTALPVIRDREAVRLVADPLQQVERLAGPWEDHRVRLTGEPDLLQPLRQPAEPDVVIPSSSKAAAAASTEGAAVDDHEGRRVGELRGDPVPGGSAAAPLSSTAGRRR